MSLHGFQSALAVAIRVFEHEKPKTIDELAALFELSPQEKQSLSQVITQQRLRAYSEELFFSRWTIIREGLEFLQPFLDFAALRTLWVEHFEPRSSTVFHEDLTLRFLDFLVDDPKGIQFISTNTEEFVPSLMRYVRCIFTFRHNVLPKVILSPHSLLTDRCFKVLELNYDVREFFSELMELENFNDVKLPPPSPVLVRLLFVASDEVTEFRSFEIDDELHAFLLNHQEGDASAQRPACYNDLVDLGLCESKTMKKACCDVH